MKRIISYILIVSCLLGSTNSVWASNVNMVRGDKKFQVSSWNGENVSAELWDKIENEMEALEQCNLDTSVIEKINVRSENISYMFNFNGTIEEVELLKNDQTECTYRITSGEIENVVSVKADGSIIVDGFKIQYSSEELQQSDRGVIWTSTKSLSPYGSLSPSDYNDFAASGTKNLALGQAIDEIAIGTLSTLIGGIDTFAGLAVSLLNTVASGVKTAISKEDPTTTALGCKYTTYTHGAYDYKYINKFYANKECTGNYYQKISYEHFTLKV